MRFWTLAIIVGLSFCLRAGVAEEPSTAAEKHGNVENRKVEKPKTGKSDADDEFAQFVRITRAKGNVPKTMETAIVRHVPAAGDREGLYVDLIGAIHIADRSYYEKLNREFQNYDAVLYELVAPENANKPSRDAKPGNHPVAMVQNGMKDLLGLEYQLKGIDYTQKNMVHADMSPEQFSRSMSDRGETATGMFARMMGYAMSRDASQGNNLSMLTAMFSQDRTTALKRAMAEQFDGSMDSLAALDGPKGSTLVAGRNQAALAVLRKEIDAGKKKIAIFYGAAHMPDFQKRLRDDFGLKPSSIRWLTAWNMETSGKSPSPTGRAQGEGDASTANERF